MILGKPFAASSFGHCFVLTQHQITSLLAVYGFVASVLPVWLLLTPRDYLSTFMKIGTIAFLVARRHHREPARCRCRRSRSSSHGGGPIIPGPLFPFVFITIACGAISGFHALIASGTTPKMIDKESRHPADRLRRDADGGPRRRHGADRRRRAPPGRLLRHQHAAGGVRARSA